MATVAYGCLPPERQYPEGPWYPDPVIPQIPIPVGPNTFYWPYQTESQRIFNLELKCQELEKRISELENNNK